MGNENSYERCANSILLDMGSNISVFNNALLLTNIHPSGLKQHVCTNSGHQDLVYAGHLPGFLNVWFNSESHLNILSFTEMSRKF